MLIKRLKKRLDGFNDYSVKGKRKVNNLFKLMVNTPELWEWNCFNVQGHKGGQRLRAQTVHTNLSMYAGHTFLRVPEKELVPTAELHPTRIATF